MVLFLGKVFKAVAKGVGSVFKAIPKAVSKFASSFAKLGGPFLGTVASLLGGPAGLIAKGLGGLKGLGGILGNVLGKLFPFPKNLPFNLQDLGKILKGVFDIVKTFSSGKFLEGLKKVFDLGSFILGKLLGGQAPKPAPETPNLPPGTGIRPPVVRPPVGGGEAPSTPPTGGVSGGDKALLDAASKAYDSMNSIEKEIQSLDPNDPNYQKKLMQLQFKMQKIMQMIQMITQLLRMKHDMSMQIIRNIRY